MARIRVAMLPALMAASMACGGSKDPQQAAAGGTQQAQGVAAGDFGVPECDEYFRKYLECINSKVPASAQAMVKKSLDDTKEQWKRAAATSQGRAGLVAGCTQATQAAKQAVSAWGCKW